MARLTIEDVQYLTHEIRDLVSAGLPLEQSLADAGRGAGLRLGRLTESIQQGLDRGESLEDLVTQLSVGESRMLASVIGAGVRSSDLSLTLEMMGDFAEDIIAMRSTLLQAITYPLTIVAVAGILIVLVVQDALEQIHEVVLQWGVPASPVAMKLLDLNQKYPHWALAFPVLFVAMLLFWGVTGRASSLSFRGPERLLLLLPGVGSMIRDLRHYTVTRMISLLTERSLPLYESLILAGGASGCRRLDKACTSLAEALKRGARIDRSGILNDAASPQTNSLPNSGTAVIRGENRDDRTDAKAMPPLLAVCLEQTQFDESRMFHRLRSVAAFYRCRFERNAAWVRLVTPVGLFLIIGGTTVLGYCVLVFLPVTELYSRLGQVY